MTVSWESSLYGVEGAPVEAREHRELARRMRFDSIGKRVLLSKPGRTTMALIQTAPIGKSRSMKRHMDWRRSVRLNLQRSSPEAAAALVMIFEYIETARRRMYYHFLRAATARVSIVRPATRGFRSCRGALAHTAGRKPRLFFMGTDLQQDSCGLLQSLERVFDLQVFHRADGTYGLFSPHNSRRFDGDRLNYHTILESLARLQDEGWVPDIILFQGLPEYLSAGTLRLLRERTRALLINLGMDDRHACVIGLHAGELRGTLGYVGVVDLALTAAKEFVGLFRSWGLDSLYIPEASDPHVFHPVPVQQDIDVLFVGRNYGYRSKLIEAISYGGWRIECFGRGFSNGMIDFSRINELYNRAKIVLGASYILASRNWTSLKLRDFDVPMSGAFYLTSFSPELAELYDDGNEIAMYRNITELRRLVALYLGNGGLRSKIARAGQERAARCHTWDQRFLGVREYLVSGGVPK